MIRIPYSNRVPLDNDYTLIYKTRTGERKIPPHKWWINRQTPVGEDAELLERKPYGGVKVLDWQSLIAVEK